MVNLTGVDIDGTEDEHIIGSAQESIVHGEDVSAGAPMGNEPRQIPGSVANEGSRFLSQSRDHHFPYLPLGDGFEGLRVEDFKDVIVRPVMNPFMLGTFQTRILARIASLDLSDP